MSDTPSRIVVRVTNWIGDALMNTPAIAALRRLYPEAHISVIAKPWVHPLFEENPHIDRLLPYDPVKGFGRSGSFLELVTLLRRERFDLGVAFQNAFEAAFVMFAGGVRRRVGYARDGRRFLLTDPIPATPDLLGVHEARYYLHLIQRLGSQETDPEPYTLKLRHEERLWAETFLRRQGLSLDKPVLAVNPGATYGSAKRWAPARFARVADTWADQYGAQVVILGTQNEYPAAVDIKAAMKTLPVILSGQTSLRQLAAVLERCRLLLTNDSGTMHVACAVQTPIIAIFGSTNPKTTHPWGVPFAIVREEVECSPCLLRECPIDHRCMERVTPGIVLDRTEAFVRETFGRKFPAPPGVVPLIR